MRRSMSVYGLLLLLPLSGCASSATNLLGGSFLLKSAKSGRCLESNVFSQATGLSCDPSDSAQVLQFIPSAGGSWGLLKTGDGQCLCAEPGWTMPVWFGEKCDSDNDLWLWKYDGNHLILKGVYSSTMDKVNEMMGMAYARNQGDDCLSVDKSDTLQDAIDTDLCNIAGKAAEEGGNDDWASQKLINFTKSMTDPGIQWQLVEVPGGEDTSPDDLSAKFARLPTIAHAEEHSTIAACAALVGFIAAALISTAASRALRQRAHHSSNGRPDDNSLAAE